MKNREIKFRAYFGGTMYYSDSQESAKLLNIPLGKSIIGGFMAAFTFDETLMQFTGLHDKNGKEIYEGDIINASYFKLAICVWWNSGWYIKQYGNHFTFNTAKHTLEIIGNIYQHPELLK